MLYNPPTGGAANDPYVGKNVAAGTQGSKVPPGAVEYPQRELVALIVASGQTPTNTDQQQALRSVRSGVLEYFTDSGAANAPAISPSPAHTSLVDGLHVRVRMKASPTGPTNLSINALGAPVQRVGGVALTGGEWAANDVVDLVYNGGRNAFQIAGLTKNDVAQATYGATSQGGLAKDASSNFLLAYLNLLADNRAAPVGADLLALERNSDGATVSISASALASYILSFVKTTNTFQQLTANPILYVGGTGASDSNDGKTTATPKATIAGALAASVAFNFATTSLTIQLQATGTYALPSNIPAASGPITIQGQAGGGYIITSAGASISGNVTFNYVTLQNTTSNSATFLAQSGAAVTLQNTVVQLLGGGTSVGMITGPGGTITLNGGVSFQGGGQFAIYANGGAILIGSATFTVVGTPAFVAFACASPFGEIFVTGGASFSGGATGGRYAVGPLGLIQTNGGGANFFPGSIAGTVTSPGQYL